MAPCAPALGAGGGVSGFDRSGECSGAASRTGRPSSGARGLGRTEPGVREAIKVRGVAAGSEQGGRLRSPALGRELVTRLPMPGVSFLLEGAPDSPDRRPTHKQTHASKTATCRGVLPPVGVGGSSEAE